MKNIKIKQKLGKNNLSHLTILFGLLGTLCLIISHFIPCLTIGGLSKFLINEEFYLIVLAGISIVSVFFGDLIIPTVTSGVALWFFIDYTNRINTVYKQYASTTTIFYGVGYYLLVVGFALTITYVVFGLREKLRIRKQFRKEHPKDSLKNTTINEEKPMSFTKSPLLDASAKQPGILVEEPVKENPTFLQTSESMTEKKGEEIVVKEEPKQSIWSQPIEEVTPQVPEVKQPENPNENQLTQVLVEPESVQQQSSIDTQNNQNEPKTFTSFYDFELSPEELQRNIVDKK